MSTKKPNILLIMDDQHRYDWMGCAGADFLHTPNIDRLAAMGMRFSQTYSPAPICVPARCGLAAGVQPFRLGALDNNVFFPLGTTTYYQRLRDHGYHVGMVGKHDLAKQDYRRGRRGDRPLSYTLGFTHPQETLGKGEGGRYPQPQCPYTHWLAEQGLYESFYQDYSRRAAKNTFLQWVKDCAWDSVLPAHAFHDAFIGQRGAAWLEEAAQSDFPWHYMISFVGPHDPYDPPTEFAEKYRTAAVPQPFFADESQQPAWLAGKRWDMTPEEVTTNRRQNCASIEAIDQQIGFILDTLERNGQLQNTYIFFTSDHGDMLGDHHLWTKAVAYEGSVKIPLIAAGPGIPAGTVNEALVELSDLNPTICEIAGLPTQENLDAQSFCQALHDPQQRHRRDVISSLRNWRMIRDERYKFVENYNDLDELYDLQQDPQETHNLINDLPELAGQLKKRLLYREEKMRPRADLLVAG